MAPSSSVVERINRVAWKYSSMNLKLVGLLALVIISSGCLASFNNSEKEPEDPDNEVNESINNSTENTQRPTTNVENVTTVTYTDSGFSPQTVTVDVGDTVRWESEASSPMWVGSDQHPTHTEYSGNSLNQHCENGDQTEAAFDQCSTGETFTFTFEKAGEWGYHNHRYRPQTYTGTVIVE
jgi:plastocyanin